MKNLKLDGSRIQFLSFWHLDDLEIGGKTKIKGTNKKLKLTVSKDRYERKYILIKRTKQKNDFKKNQT